MPRRLEGLEQDVADAYRAGATIRVLAEQYECSKHTIQRALIAAGVTSRPRGKPSPLAGHDNAITTRYTGGETIQQLADRYGVATATVRNSLARTGTPTRPVGRPRRA